MNKKTLVLTLLACLLASINISHANIIGDINDDGSVNLTDAIIASQILSGIIPPQNIYNEADVNGDGKIGLEESIYAMQVAVELTFIQKDLEGIWYTENRYFFIDDTGQLINTEPISTEIIYDFSGAFAVENKNVIIGTIYLDHQHSGNSRHNHNINYSGTIVDFDEIDVDWDVPGAGTGSETWRRISYSGSIEQALIDAENALILATGVEQSINPVDNLIIYYLTGTSTTVDEVIAGSCGGNANIYGIIDAQTGEFAGTLQYVNFCDEDTGEYTLNGPAEFTGYTNLENHRPFRFQYYFGDVAFDRQNVSFAIRGRKGFNFTISPRSMILSYVFTDKNTGINYWLKDYINRLTHVENYGDISSAIGKYYDPNYGYVEISVGETIRKYDGDEWPSSGKLLLTGVPGSKGGNTKIRVSYLNKTTYLVEADTDGDGAYDDYYSGTLFWSEL